MNDDPRPTRLSKWRTLMSKADKVSTAADSTAPKQQIGVPFKPGQSGNPAGRPKGAKSKFQEDFWRDLHRTWQEGGRDALKRMMRDMPDKFVTVAAGKVPQELEVTNSTYVIVAPEASTSTQEWLDTLSVRRPDQHDTVSTIARVCNALMH
jgi:hypothetical protein